MKPANFAPSGDFSIGSRVWPGTSKLIEEMGELQQVLGKLIAIAGATDHWSGDLRKMLVEELGDVSAAIRFFGTQNLTTKELTFVAVRSDSKLARFREWHLDPKPPPATAAPPPRTDPPMRLTDADVAAVVATALAADPPAPVVDQLREGLAEVGASLHRQFDELNRELLDAGVTLGDALGGGDGKPVTELAEEAVAQLRELRAKVQAFERAEEIGFNAQALHDRLDTIHDAIAKRPVVKPVEGSKVGEFDFVHDDHSHLYVPSSEYDRVLQELRFFAEIHVNDGDELGVRARAALKTVER